MESSWLYLIVAQLHLLPNFPANPANPIQAVLMEWTTGDSRRRTVDVWTQTVRFEVYPSQASPASQSRLTGLIEGHSEIRVTPSPGTLALALGIAALARQRR